MNHVEITLTKGRLFVCGDIHGEYKKLLEKLDSLDFDYDNDLLISPGDLVDRGPDSLSCFNLIYKSWFMSTRGNHEAFCSDYIYKDSHLIESDNLLLKNNHIYNGGKWFYDLPHDVRVSIAEAVLKMPIAITVHKNDKKYGFLHADIPNYIKSWNEIVSGLSEENINKDQFIDSLIWGRGRIRKIYHDMTINIEDVDHIYLGHTVLRKPLSIGNTHYIDTGACFGADGYGELTILEL